MPASPSVVSQLRMEVAEKAQQLEELKLVRRTLSEELHSLRRSTEARSLQAMHSELLTAHQEIEKLRHGNREYSEKLAKADRATLRALEDATELRQSLGGLGAAFGALQPPDSSVGTISTANTTPTSSGLSPGGTSSPRSVGNAGFGGSVSNSSDIGNVSSVGSAGGGFGGAGLAGGTLRRTLLAMSDAHKLLSSQARLLRSVFPPGLAAEELSERAKQAHATAGAPEVLSFLLGHINALNKLLMGQPGALPLPSPQRRTTVFHPELQFAEDSYGIYVAPAVVLPDGSDKPVAGPPRTLAPLPLKRQRPAVTPESLEGLTETTAGLLRALQAVGRERFRADACLQLSCQHVANVMSLFVEEVRWLQGTPQPGTPPSLDKSVNPDSVGLVGVRGVRSEGKLRSSYPPPWSSNFSTRPVMPGPTAGPGLSPEPPGSPVVSTPSPRPPRGPKTRTTWSGGGVAVTVQRCSSSPRPLSAVRPAFALSLCRAESAGGLRELAQGRASACALGSGGVDSPGSEGVGSAGLGTGGGADLGNGGGVGTADLGTGGAGALIARVASMGELGNNVVAGGRAAGVAEVRGTVWGTVWGTVQGRGQQEQTEEAGSGEVVRYAVCVRTSKLQARPYEGDVFLTLHGASGPSPEIQLPGAHRLSSDEEQCLEISAPDLGELRSVSLRTQPYHPNAPWHLDQVRLTSTKACSGRGLDATFHHHHWVVPGARATLFPKSDLDAVEYDVLVCTADARGAGAGQEGSIEVKMVGERGCTDWLQLSDTPAAFLRGSEAHFTVSAADVHSLTSLVVRLPGHQDKDSCGVWSGWKPERFEVVRRGGAWRSIFYANQWISSHTQALLLYEAECTPV